MYIIFGYASYPLLKEKSNNTLIDMTQKKIKNIALGGGGFYGYAHVGALKALSELENYSDYFDVDTIKGVSVGSMVAALYSVGYSADELTKILYEMDFDKLIRDTNFAYFKLWRQYGMYEANKLEEEIEKLIRNKTNIKFCTFNQIDMNLIILATNLNYQRLRSFNRESTPLMPISKAVRLSIGYPPVMTPVIFEGDLYGDGGEFMNYPISTCDNLDETIGITFASYNENSNGTLINRVPIDGIVDYITTLGTTMSRAAYVSQITDACLNRSIVIHITEHINSMQFKLTTEQKKFIYNCGTTAVSTQINKILGTNTNQSAINTSVINASLTNISLTNTSLTNTSLINIDNTNTSITNIDNTNTFITNIDNRNISITNIDNTNTSVINSDNTNIS